MTTYDPSLPDDLNWVRFLTGDTADPSQVQDGEIEGLITSYTTQYGAGEWIRYLVAADLLENRLVGWAWSSKGKTSESVSKLSISRGGADTLFVDRARGYRERANRLLAAGGGIPYHFAVV
jgi:hypothetical protein